MYQYDFVLIVHQYLAVIVTLHFRAATCRINYGIYFDMQMMVKVCERVVYMHTDIIMHTAEHYECMKQNRVHKLEHVHLTTTSFFFRFCCVSV